MKELLQQMRDALVESQTINDGIEFHDRKLKAIAAADVEILKPEPEPVAKVTRVFYGEAKPPAAFTGVYLCETTAIHELPFNVNAKLYLAPPNESDAVALLRKIRGLHMSNAYPWLGLSIDAILKGQP